MFLKSLSRIRKTIGFRISIWHSGILIVSSLLLLIVAHYFLSSVLTQKDREGSRLKLNQTASQYEKDGIEGIRKEIALQRTLGPQDSYFIRVAGPRNNTLVSSDAADFEDFDLNELQTATGSPEAWIRLTEPEKKHMLDTGEILEITTRPLPDGNLLQVGKTSEYRGDLLERFRWSFGLVMIPLLLLVATLLSVRTLRPLRSMIDTVKSIQDGKLDSRVKTTGTGDELDELANLFNGMLDRIENLIEGMQNSLDNVAHDLRTPLTRLRAVAEGAFQSEPNQDTYREALADCMEESEHILAMLNMLMDISEAEAGSIKLNLENIPVLELMEDTADLYRYVAEDKGLQISVDCPEDLRVTADRNRTRQALANLVDNAVKYTEPGGEINLQAHQSDGEVIIHVSDTGIGIPPEELPRIWERLYRSNDVRSSKGIGLGLSLVRAIVQGHGGTVEVISQSGKGSVFKIHLQSPQPTLSDRP